MTKTFLYFLRSVDYRWAGCGCYRQEDLLDGYRNKPDWSRQPRWLHEESLGLAEPGQPSGNSFVPWNGVSVFKRLSRSYAGLLISFSIILADFSPGICTGQTGVRMPSWNGLEWMALDVWCWSATTWAGLMGWQWIRLGPSCSGLMHILRSDSVLQHCLSLGIW